MLLEIKDLKVHYGGVQALQGVSLDMEEGEIRLPVGWKRGRENYLGQYYLRISGAREWRNPVQWEKNQRPSSSCHCQAGNCPGTGRERNFRNPDGIGKFKNRGLPDSFEKRIRTSHWNRFMTSFPCSANEETNWGEI